MGFLVDIKSAIQNITAKQILYLMVKKQKKLWKMPVNQINWLHYFIQDQLKWKKAHHWNYLFLVIAQNS